LLFGETRTPVADAEVEYTAWKEHPSMPDVFLAPSTTAEPAVHTFHRTDAKGEVTIPVTFIVSTYYDDDTWATPSEEFRYPYGSLRAKIGEEWIPCDLLGLRDRPQIVVEWGGASGPESNRNVVVASSVPNPAAKEATPAGARKSKRAPKYGR
jgi:hypothetical protein